MTAAAPAASTTPGVPGDVRRVRARVKASIAPGRVAKWLIVGIIGAVFLVPIAADVLFTLRDNDTGGLSLTHWGDLVDPARASIYRPVWIGLGNSLVLSVVTVGIVLVLLAPTMVLVSLRFPKLRRLFEFICLLPISIPAIVMVVGLAPIYQVIGRTFGTGIWSLAFAYGITVLPYAYRSIQNSIDAVDITTLSEAARSLGAGWTTVLVRVLAPNLRGGLLAASLISIAVVLGEFTIASLLNRPNFQTMLLVVSKQDAYVSVILTLLALLFAFLLLLGIGRVGSIGARKDPSR